MIKIEVDTRETLSSFKRLSYIDDAIEPKQQALQFFVDRIDQGFVTQRDPYGDAWVPLSDATLGLRRGTGQALIDSGDMRASLRIEGDTVVMDDPASYHQEGGEISVFGRAGHTLPQRRIFPIIGDAVVLPPYWDAAMLEIYDAWVERQ